MSIASAITVADPIDEDPPAANPLKRSHTTEGEEPEKQQSKRRRNSSGKKSPGEEADGANGTEGVEPPVDADTTKDESPATLETRRRPSVADEKQRSKRLFGALLGNLNRPTDRTSKKRQEIETRRKAELQRQDDERVEDKLRKQEMVAEVRRKEQIAVEEENMRIRHENLLHMANFLQTTAEPRLYYRPWDLRPDEAERIQQQKKDAYAQIDRELGRPDQDQQIEEHSDPRRTTRDRSSEEEPVTSSQQREDGLQRPSSEHAGLNGEKITEADEAPAKSDGSKSAEVPDSDSKTAANPNTNRDEPNGTSVNDVAHDRGGHVDEEADHIVDGDEDTVIY